LRAGQDAGQPAISEVVNCALGQQANLLRELRRPAGPPRQVGDSAVWVE
jgi:hypothetical protein